MGKEHRKSRKTWCRKNMKRKVGFWRSVTFIDNKSWCAPTTKKASKTIQEKRVRGMYRTRGQGFEEGCTREGFKHRTAAPTIHATNVISGGAIKVMKIGEKWDGAAAARMIIPVISMTLQNPHTSNQIKAPQISRSRRHRYPDQGATDVLVRFFVYVLNRCSSTFFFVYILNRWSGSRGWGGGGSLIVQSPQNPTESRGAATK